MSKEMMELINEIEKLPPDVQEKIAQQVRGAILMMESMEKTA